MSIVASRRKLAKQVRSIKGKQGKAAAANIIGEEIDDLLGAYAVKTAPTKAKNENIETGAEEAGVELEELNLCAFDKNAEGKTTRNKSFFKNLYISPRLSVMFLEFLNNSPLKIKNLV